MKQRVPGRAWYSPGRPGRRPRVLVENDSKAPGQVEALRQELASRHRVQRI